MKKLFLSFVSALFLVNFFPAAAEQPANFSSPYAQSRPAYSQRIHWLDHYDTATSQARQTSQPILILFTGTNWCPACIKLEKQVLSNSRFAQTLADRLIFLKAEFPSYTAESMEASVFYPLLNRYQVSSFPTMVVVNASGQLLFEVPYQNADVDAYLQEILSKLNNYFFIQEIFW